MFPRFNQVRKAAVRQMGLVLRIQHDVGGCHVAVDYARDAAMVQEGKCSCYADGDSVPDWPCQLLRDDEPLGGIFPFLLRPVFWMMCICMCTGCHILNTAHSASNARNENKEHKLSTKIFHLLCTLRLQIKAAFFVFSFLFGLSQDNEKEEHFLSMDRKCTAMQVQIQGDNLLAQVQKSQAI